MARVWRPFAAVVGVVAAVVTPLSATASVESPPIDLMERVWPTAALAGPPPKSLPPRGESAFHFFGVEPKSSPSKAFRSRVSARTITVAHPEDTPSSGES